MPKGIPKKRYTGAFKQVVVEDMREKALSQCETATKYGIARAQVQRWERIYLEEGLEGLYIERRGRASILDGVNKGRPKKLDNQIQEDLIAENQRLRMENEYLKKLNALVREKEILANKTKLK